MVVFKPATPATPAVSEAQLLSHSTSHYLITITLLTCVSYIGSSELVDQNVHVSSEWIVAEFDFSVTNNLAVDISNRRQTLVG